MELGVKSLELRVWSLELRVWSGDVEVKIVLCLVFQLWCCTSFNHKVLYLVNSLKEEFHDLIFTMNLLVNF